MIGNEFFGNFDLASAAIWMFWIFFALLVYYLQTENMREGYPLEREDGNESASIGLFPTPADKTFHLPHGRGDVSVPSGQNAERTNLAIEATSASAGSPYVPTGNPMVDGVGPAAWAPRRDVTELDAHGHDKIKPMADLPDFEVSAGRDPRGKPVVAGDGEVIGRIIDMWIDVPEQMVRYLTVDLNPEGTGQTRLIPINFCRIQHDRVTVRSIYSGQFADVPGITNTGRVTLLEEEKIMAYYGGGTLYADPSRSEPKI
ncbi:photosynthetic reaction center subunit H [Rhodobacteraceae bacterium]|nr:photosynthetic reaction center subunit H [Paracoccaceae bacterium]